MGVLVGSFINVVALRYNTGLSFTKGRSVCFSCGLPLLWFDLVPLFSFLFLRGKCRKCKSHISWQYPIVELLSGCMFVAIALRQWSYYPLYSAFSHGIMYSILFFIFYAFVFSLLLVICLYDIRHKIIPNGLVYTFIILSVLKLFLFVYCAGFVFNLPLVLDLSAPFILSIPFGTIWYLSNGKWIGFGDVKLMFGIGALLGLASGLSAIVFGFWIGAIWGVTAMVLQKRIPTKGKPSKKLSMNSEVPFAPFLIAGTVIVFLSHVDIFSISQFISLTH